MRAQRKSTVFLVITAVTLVVVLAFRVRTGASADAIAVLRTTGMTCGTCSNKIIKTLATVQGVAVTEVDIAGGWVIVGYDTKSVMPEVLAEKVCGAGFGSKVDVILSPEQFKQRTGKDIGKKAVPSGGCGGCGTKAHTSVCNNVKLS